MGVGLALALVLLALGEFATGEPMEGVLYVALPLSFPVGFVLAAAGAELGHVVEATLVVGDELRALVHREGRLPGHRHLAAGSARTVWCYPSSRNILLPINPGCTVARGMTSRYAATCRSGVTRRASIRPIPSCITDS